MKFLASIALVRLHLGDAALPIVPTIESRSLLQVGAHHASVNEPADWPTFDPKSDRVMILTSPKTASTSMQRGFDKCFFDELTFFNELPDSYPQAARTHMGSIAKDFFAQSPEGANLWLLTSTRHIFSKAVSGYFQHMAKTYKDKKDDFLSMPLEQVIGGFEDALAMDEVKDADALDDIFGFRFTWMQDEYKDALGIDLSEEEKQFPDDKPLLRLQKTLNGRTLNILVARVEEIGQWDELIGETFPCFKMPEEGAKRNIAEERWYADIYAAFKQNFSPSPESLRKLNDVDGLSRFYSDSEQDQFIQKTVEKAHKLPCEDCTLLNLLQM